MEQLEDIKEYINNFEDLTEEEKIFALEQIYRKQLKCTEIPRTLQEIIDKQIELKNKEK